MNWSYVEKTLCGIGLKETEGNLCYHSWYSGDDSKPEPHNVHYSIVIFGVSNKRINQTLGENESSFTKLDIKIGAV